MNEEAYDEMTSADIGKLINFVKGIMPVKKKHCDKDHYTYKRVKRLRIMYTPDTKRLLVCVYFVDQSNWNVRVNNLARLFKGLM